MVKCENELNCGVYFKSGYSLVHSYFTFWFRNQIQKIYGTNAPEKGNWGRIKVENPLRMVQFVRRNGNGLTFPCFC